MDVCLLWMLCVVRRRANHSFKGALPTVFCVCVCVWSVNLTNEAALARVGLLRQRRKAFVMGNGSIMPKLLLVSMEAL
jgi:hypothetical protein